MNRAVLDGSALSRCVCCCSSSFGDMPRLGICRGSGHPHHSICLVGAVLQPAVTRTTLRQTARAGTGYAHDFCPSYQRGVAFVRTSAREADNIDDLQHRGRSPGLQRRHPRIRARGQRALQDRSAAGTQRVTGAPADDRGRAHPLSRSRQLRKSSYPAERSRQTTRPSISACRRWNMAFLC
jgi:hypothetical protein